MRLFKVRRLVFALFLILCFSTAMFVNFSSAEEAEINRLPDQKIDIQGLLKRVDRLEKENQSLRDELIEIRRQIKQIDTVEDEPADKNVMVSKPPVNIDMYGFVKVSASNDSTTGGELVVCAASDATDNEDDEFNISARETRAGFNFTGPTVGEEGKLSGKFEFDLLRGDETFPQMRTRHAYAKLEFPRYDVTAGHTWDFFTPLGPSTLNHGWLCRGGNLGLRSPQIILKNKFPDALGGDVSTNIGIIDTNTDTQERMGLPAYGAYVDWEGEIFGKPLYLGIGSMSGRAEDRITGDDLDMWALTGGLTLGFTDKVALKGEFYNGANLAPFFSTNNAGVDNGEPVRSGGGWAQLSLKPVDRTQINIGGGSDNIYSDIITTLGTNWEYNYTYFMNCQRDLTENLCLGVEYQYFRTKYTDDDIGDLGRVQTSLIYKF